MLLWFVLSYLAPNFNYLALLIIKNRKREVVSFVGNITSNNVPLILRVFAIFIIMVKIINIKLFFHIYYTIQTSKIQINS